MKEFIIDSEYKLLYNPDTKQWDTYQNNILLSKSTKALYKFYCLNLNNVAALLNNYFHLSNPSDFNDPFDCNVNLLEDITDLGQMKTVKRNSYTNVGICSFSETIDNHLMWAHYTNNYNGFALQFKGENIETKMKQGQFKRHTLTRVIYPEKPVKISKDFPFALHYVLTTKMKHWAYEKEWRIITQLETDERKLKYLPVSVDSIFIGHRIPDENKSAYELLLNIQEIRFPKVPVYVVYPHSTDLKLNFEKVWN